MTTLQQVLDIDRKQTKSGKVYGHVRGTNIYLLRWVITKAQRDLFFDMRKAV